jgi:hypothetical protein
MAVQPSACVHNVAQKSWFPTTFRSLQDNEQLEELALLGNPCTKWAGYRPYVVGTLPRLKILDGDQVRLVLAGHTVSSGLEIMRTA